MFYTIKHLVTSFKYTPTATLASLTNNNANFITITTASIYAGLYNTVNQGKLKHLLDFFNNKHELTDSLITTVIVTNFSNTLTHRFNITATQAQNIAGYIIPAVLQQLVNKTNDTADDSFTIERILKVLSSGQIKGDYFKMIVDKYNSGELDNITGEEPEITFTVFKPDNIFENLKAMLL